MTRARRTIRAARQYPWQRCARHGPGGLGYSVTFAPPRILFPLLLLLLFLPACGEEESTARPPAQVADSSARYPIGDTALPGAKPVTKTMSQVTPAPRPDAPLPENATCVTAACHATFASGRQVHGPVGTGACDSCHAPDIGGHNYPLLRDPLTTCTFCHNVSGMREHLHTPLTDAATGCTACHDPHVSQTKFLLTAPTVADLCSKCHETPLKHYTHDPVAKGQCTLCHMPHEADNAKLLRGGEGNQHCYSCHEPFRRLIANSPFVHEPAGKDCKTCHDPHASDHPYELSAPVKDACFTCHSDLEKTVAGATSPHAAVFTGHQCANCHNPHATGREKLLSDRTDQLCLQCHDQPIITAAGHTVPNMKPIIADRKFLHGPVKTGQCDACHNAHGSTNARLLKQSFPDAFYADFDESIYALCFTCHDAALVQTEKTTTLTDFRNGDVNLHYVHVHRDRKGRTCKTCHSIHGSDQPKHMASDVPFEGSDWTMPLKFKKSDTGGSCAPGCHEPYTYRRSEEGAP